MDKRLCINAMKKCRMPEVIHMDREKQYLGKKFRKTFEGAGRILQQEAATPITRIPDGIYCKLTI
mgnify:CR=1 FL=1